MVNTMKITRYASATEIELSNGTTVALLGWDGAKRMRKARICYVHRAAFDQCTRCGREVASMPVGRITGFWDSVTCKKCLEKRRSA